MALLDCHRQRLKTTETLLGIETFGAINLKDALPSLKTTETLLGIETGIPHIFKTPFLVSKLLKPF